MRNSIGAMKDTTPRELANLLGNPPKDSPQYKLVENYITPTIRHMQEAMPLSMAFLFPQTSLLEHQVPAEFLCSDLSVSDHFFDSLVLNNFSFNQRNNLLWNPLFFVNTGLAGLPLSIHQLNYECIEAISPELPYSPPLTDIDEDMDEYPLPAAPILPLGSHCIIATTYDPALPQNKASATSRSQDNKQWTEDQRNAAGQAIAITDVNNLSDRLSNFYHHGCKKNLSDYT
ncbi:hypothetical protein HD554DRAFT_1099195 [Boletus coccyginus]|nr:hypothetical protein HD554DRAFT_1099195 [Boletus coccyginus]